MNPRFSVSTKGTLHRPIEVEIDGVIYTIRLNKKSFESLRDIEKKIREIDPATGNSFDSVFLLYEEVALFTGAPRDVIEEIDFSDLQKLVEFVMKAYYGKSIQNVGTENALRVDSINPAPIKGDVPEKDDEKNGFAPGASQSLT